MLKEKNRQDSELKRIINVLPTMTNAEILKYRKEFGEVTLPKGQFDLPKYLGEQNALGWFADDCQVLALGQWESEAYWIKYWHEFLGTRVSSINYDEYMFFAIEATLDRAPYELASIQSPLLKYHHDHVRLKRSFQEQCKEASARKKELYDYRPIIEHQTLQEYILSAIEDPDMRYLIVRAHAAELASDEEDLLADQRRLLDVLAARECPQRAKYLIDILVGRRELYIKELFTSFDEQEENPLYEASWESLSEPLVTMLSLSYSSAS